MHQTRDIVSQQLDAMWNYLAFVPRDQSLSLSAQVARDAAAGNVWARRVMHSRVLESPLNAETIAPVEDLIGAPLPSIAVAARPVVATATGPRCCAGVTDRMFARHRRRSVGMMARRAAHAPLASLHAKSR